MTQKTIFYPLQGGLDLTTPAIALPPGRSIAALNYESHASGYRRLAGYERYDGRLSPTDAYDAEDDIEDGAAARDVQRALITAVPGSGPVRGVWYYDGDVYAFRDNAGATACVMHKATASGWDEVALSRRVNFTSGGVTEISEGQTITGATSAATATINRVVLTSGAWADGDAAGYLIFDSQTGTFSGENLNIGGTLNVATIAGDSSPISLAPGGRYFFINHNFYGASNLYRMYGCDGVNQAFEFDGTTFCPVTTGMPVDAPIRIAAHKKHLFLAFPGGSVQHSVTGDPLLWDAILGAAEIAVGREITDFITANADSLTILTRESVVILMGNDVTDWNLQTLTDEAGALPYTAERMGTPIYMDNRGVRSITTSQSYGNFELGTMTYLITPFLRQKIKSGILPTAAVRVRSKDLYRVFFSDNTGLSLYIGRPQPEVLPFALDHKVECACAVEDEASNLERVFIGSDNGFVYEMDKGRSFDGESVSYYMRLPFHHLGAPQVIKRWHKAVIDCDIIGTATLGISGEVDYADPDEPGMTFTQVNPHGGGGFWDTSIWGQFNWNAPIEGQAEAYLDGIGRNMSLLIGGSAADEDPHLLQGITLYFSVRGLKR